MTGRPTVAVVGGGIAGLAAAWELSAAGDSGPEVVVLEADGRVGGKLAEAEVGGRPVDVGPDAFVARRPEAVALCGELGLAGRLLAPGTAGASVWARGRLRPLPDGLALGVPTRLGPLVRSGICSPGGAARAALDAVGLGTGRGGGTGTDAAVGALVRRHLGRQVERRLADPLIGGIHAGPAATMSARAVFPALLEAAAGPGGLMRRLRGAVPPPSGGPVFLAPPDGMASLPGLLAGALAARGVAVRTGCRVEALAPDGGGWVLETAAGRRAADAVILACPAPAAAGLLESCDRELAAALAGVAQAAVTVVTLRFAEAALPDPLPPGTGFLVPAEQGLLTTGCTFLCAKWPRLHRPGERLVRVSAGRAGDRRAADLDDEAVVGRVTAELVALLAVSDAPLETRVTRWEAAFPQYAVGHLDRVVAMERAAAGLGAPLALAGATYRGVGIPACIGSGRAAAGAVAGALGR